MSEIIITARPSPVPNVCSFFIEKLIIDRSIHCKLGENTDDLLVKELFKVDGVSEVFVNNKMITISKGESSRSWGELGKEIGSVIRSTMEGEGPLFQETTPETATPPNRRPHPSHLKEEEQKMWDQLAFYFENDINPALASHNGSIELVDLKNKKAFVVMQGGCQGCAKSTETLKNGVEQFLKEKIPELESLEDMTNHLAGENPYY